MLSLIIVACLCIEIKNPSELIRTIVKIVGIVDGIAGFIIQRVIFLVHLIDLELGKVGVLTESTQS